MVLALLWIVLSNCQFQGGQTIKLGIIIQNKTETFILVFSKLVSLALTPPSERLDRTEKDSEMGIKIVGVE